MKLSYFLIGLLAVGCSSPETKDPSTPKAPAPEKVVNLYSHRHYDADKEVFARFTAATGIKVNIVQGEDDELMARMEAEGANSPCDIFITADAGRLALASKRGLLQPIKSDVLNANVPANLRAKDGQWYAITMRARIVAFNKEKVKAEQIKTYADLTKPEWKGRVLVRPSANTYNQSLLAGIIAHNGTEAATTWAQGIVKNMARDPKGGDTDQLLAIAEGLGDVAIANSYYVAKLMASDEPEKQKAKGLIAVAFPSIGNYGTHINVSGGGVGKYAPHKAEAIAFLEYLTSDEAQTLFTTVNKEYPVKKGVEFAPEIEAFGTFTPDSLDLTNLGTYNADAVKVFDAAGWL